MVEDVAVLTRELRVRLQIDRGSPRQFRLLRGADRQRAAAVTRIAAIAHFDEHERVAIAHDQIDLAVTAIEIARHCNESVRTQVILRAIFPARTGRARGCTRPAPRVCVGRRRSWRAAHRAPTVRPD